jgi:hypothetical protein
MAEMQLTVNELASRWRRSEDSIRTACREGKLPGAFQQPVPDEDLIGRILQGNGNGGG